MNINVRTALAVAAMLGGGGAVPKMPYRAPDEPIGQSTTDIKAREKAEAKRERKRQARKKK